jgi:hypothetical protein
VASLFEKTFASEDMSMSQHIDMEKKDLGFPVDADTTSKNEVDLEIDSEIGRVEINRVAEKKLMRKIDLNLITLFGVSPEWLHF